jgi:hypothetical protein
MKKQLLLTSAVCMISGVLWQGNVHAQNYAAYGFSKYCSVWQDFSNLPNLTGFIIKYTVTTPEFIVYCDDPQTVQLDCDPGTEDRRVEIFKRVTVTLNLTQLLSELEVVDCINLEDFISSDMCSANLQPIESSAHFYDVEVEYTILDLMENELLSVNVGVGEWPGTFDNNACTPSHGGYFDFGE